MPAIRTPQGLRRSCTGSAALVLALAVSGCASAPPADIAGIETPDWFKNAAAQVGDQDYPRLCDVRRPVRKTLTAGEWAAMQAELKAAGEAVAGADADPPREDPLAWAARERAKTNPPASLPDADRPPQTER